LASAFGASAFGPSAFGAAAAGVAGVVEFGAAGAAVCAWALPSQSEISKSVSLGMVVSN